MNVPRGLGAGPVPFGAAHGLGAGDVTVVGGRLHAPRRILAGIAYQKGDGGGMKTAACCLIAVFCLVGAAWGQGLCIATVDPDTWEMHVPCLAFVDSIYYINPNVFSLDMVLAGNNPIVYEYEAHRRVPLPPVAPIPMTRTTSGGDHAGSDANLQKGVPWPNPRLTDNKDGTVTDNLTGLVWLRLTNCFGELNWYDALNAVNRFAGWAYGNVEHCEISGGSVPGDWRLPNRRELDSLLDFSRYRPALPYGHPFVDVQVTYWSSTKASLADGWVIDVSAGRIFWADVYETHYVWPVRDPR